MDIFDPGHPGRPNLLTDLEDKIRRHHTLYPRTRVKADQWEEILSVTLAQLGVPNEWGPGSHRIGTDITLGSGVTVSAKSGTYDRAEQTLTFSGSRLGKHSSTLSAMVNHVLATKSDWYAFCAGPKTKSRSPEYDLFFIPGYLLDYGSPADWVQRTTESGSSVWAFGGSSLSAEIRSSMSHQLWTTLNLTHLQQRPSRSFTI